MITSHDNEKLKLVRKLAERSWRERLGAFVTEGEDLLAAGLAAGATPKAVLVKADSGAGQGEFEAEEVEPALLDRVSTLGSGTRVVAIWDTPPAPDPLPAGLCVYLHGIGDPGNVGTIIRSAHALGAASVICGPQTADPRGSKAVRASMGSVFALAIAAGGFDKAPAPRLGLVSAGGRPLGEVAGLVAAGGTICLGAERDGLPAELIAACDASATIALAPGAESLNVAAAAAIALERVNSAAVPPSNPTAGTAGEAGDPGESAGADDA